MPSRCGNEASALAKRVPEDGFPCHVLRAYVVDLIRGALDQGIEGVKAPARRQVLSSR
jgi:hypothetical protein